ncbi:MAG: precorrin-4 C(11)-methyltransferase [Spirulinaceae cyanobacterium SM2_1_0]|nr:precorrin-4 C(11)-methyltransferase [Spirulinaceae cyanobacterium SM2_1_0]
MSSLAPAVYFIGAGPGDPELLTVQAQRWLQQVDVIAYADSLVPPALLAIAKPTATRLPTSDKTLEDLIPLLVAHVQAGESVARLHSGDLSLYSAVHEQVQRLRAAGVCCQFAPGISAFQAAAARLGAELTVPELVQTVILTRVGGSASKMPAREELARLAAHGASLCLYLAARHIETAQAALLQHYSPDTPVAICFRLGWPDEQIWLTDLQAMAAQSQAANLSRTVLYLISPALAGCRWASDGEPALGRRSHLYHPDHHHQFRPPPKE